ncbi:MAG: MBL fold metallo-hydrolase, partial [Planctomycetota bacterium]
MSEVAPRLMPLFEITAGDWTVRAIDGGAIALDGGAMFGSVPRPMWERLIPPDGRHRIPLALRLLLLENERLGRRVLVDGGVGGKEEEAFRDRVGVDG